MHPNKPKTKTIGYENSSTSHPVNNNRKKYLPFFFLDKKIHVNPQLDSAKKSLRVTREKKRRLASSVLPASHPKHARRSVLSRQLRLVWRKNVMESKARKSGIETKIDEF